MEATASSRIAPSITVTDAIDYDSDELGLDADDVDLSIVSMDEL